MPQKTIELLERAAELNKSSKLRRGNVVYLPGEGRLIVAGDLHGHTRNFEKICRFADIENNPDSHVILQEVIHGGPEDDFGGCLSYKLFFDVLEYKIKYPEQVHIVMGNHDTAVIGDSNVMKAGKEMNQAMKSALQREYATGFDDVECAIRQYLLSQPLAVKCENRIWISHSLPADRYISKFDTGIFDREYGYADTQRFNPVYLLTWGRRHCQGGLDKMAEKLDVDLFILGHQPQDSGWAKAGDNAIILASDHNHGCIAGLELDKKYTLEELIKCIVPIASIE